MKQLLTNIFLELSYQLARINNKISPVKRNDKIKHAYLIIPAGDGLRPGEKKSFGDEMMLLSICENIQTSDPFASFTVLKLSGKAIKPYKFHGFTISEAAFESENHASITSYFEFTKLSRRFSHVYLMGADCLDGKYGRRTSLQRLRFISLASQLGLQTRILGFSYNGNADSRIQKELIQVSRHSKLFVRDRFSGRRLSSFIKENIVEVADMAFIVDPEKYNIPNQTREFCNKLQQLRNTQKYQIIAINLCGWHHTNLDQFLYNFAENIIRMSNLNQKLRFILLPHDNRDGKINDVATLSILENLLKPVKNKIFFADFIQTGIEAKLIVKYADILITGRMHLAIAALSQNVPALSLIYQGKFEGLYHFYDFDRLYFYSPDKTDELFLVLEIIMQNTKQLSLHIKNKNKEIFELAKRNFEELQTEKK